MTTFDTLINAAREFIEERLITLQENAFNLYTPEDVASVQREQALIEQEIQRLCLLLDVARAVARMQHVALEKGGRQAGHDEAADRIAALVAAVAALGDDSGPQKEDD